MRSGCHMNCFIVVAPLKEGSKRHPEILQGSALMQSSKPLCTFESGGAGAHAEVCTMPGSNNQSQAASATNKPELTHAV